MSVSSRSTEHRYSLRRDSFLSVADVRRATLSDLKDLKELTCDRTNVLFGDVDCKAILDTCFISVCVKNIDDNTVAFLCLHDHPNIPSIPSWDWNSWLYNIYHLEMVTARNTLWIHLAVWDNRYTYAFLPPLLKSIFGEFSFLDYIIMVIPPGVAFVDWLQGHGTRIVPQGFYGSAKVQTLFLLVRQDFVTKYKIRRAVEEDNDDLVPLIHANSERLQQNYGEFYIAEMITRQPDAGRQLIVAEYEDNAIAVLCLNETVNADLLNQEFQLAPFYGLRKAHCDDVQLNLGLLNDDTLSVDKEEASITDLATRHMQTKSEVEAEEETEDNLKSNHSDDDVEFVDLFSVHLLMPIDTDSLSSTSTNTYSDMASFFSEYESHLYSNKGTAQRINFEECIRGSGYSEHSSTIPTYNGASNAFALELAVAHPSHEIESLPLLLEAAFECFPERDYCVLSIPSTCPPFPMLNYFVRVSPRVISTYSHELYILHRNAILSTLTVRMATISDIEDVQTLIENVAVTHTLMDNFLSAVCEEQDFESHLMLSEGTIVGISVITTETNFDYIKSHYNIKQWVSEEHHKADSHALLMHVVLSPIFQRHSRFFLREIMRLSGHSVLYYYIKPSDTAGAYSDRTLCCVLGSLIPIRPRRLPEFRQTNLENCEPDDVVKREEDPFALYLTTAHHCTLVQYEINTRIVVVGSSDTALAFLTSLINSNSTSYRVNFSNVTLVSPHGLNYQKKDNNMRNMLFARKNDFSYRRMHLTSLRTYVNVVTGVMTKINRKNKMLIVNDDSFLTYDMLFLMCGKQFQKPQTSTISKKMKEFPENVFLVNTEIDGTHAFKELERFNKEGHQQSHNIIVYGYALDAYCCVAALLEYGVAPPNITFVESFPVHSEDRTLTDEPQFSDPDVDQAVVSAIKETGVRYYTSYYFADWIVDKEKNCVKTVKFESNLRRLQIDCIAMFMYNDKTVSARTFTAISSADLVFDGALVIGPDCKTNDPFIYAAGTITKYSRRYYADHLAHKYYNLEEIGFKLAQRIRRKLIPNCDEYTDGDIIICPKGNMMVPHYQEPLVTFCQLPGKLQYLSVTKPGKQIPLEVTMASDSYGHVLVTGECKKLDDQGYFRLHLNPLGVVETITCLAKFDIDWKNLASLWGKQEKLLNNLKMRFEMMLIPDLFDYFREPWTCAIYHDRYVQLDSFLQQLLATFTNIKGDSPLEDLMRMYEGNDWKKLSFEQQEEVEEKFRNSKYHKIIEERLLEFLQENRSFLPMYAHPNIVRRLLMGCEDSPLFNPQ